MKIPKASPARFWRWVGICVQSYESQSQQKFSKGWTVFLGGRNKYSSPARKFLMRLNFVSLFTNSDSVRISDRESSRLAFFEVERRLWPRNLKVEDFQVEQIVSTLIGWLKKSDVMFLRWMTSNDAADFVGGGRMHHEWHVLQLSQVEVILPTVFACKAREEYGEMQGYGEIFAPLHWRWRS